jgi:GNAT superfamily N-acetyltransferase
LKKKIAPPERAKISVAKTPAQIARCHKVMRELRPQFRRRARFVDRVRLQQRSGYFLAFLESDGEVRAVAGYRILESLFSGRCMYVDDLVTLATDRSAGYGGQLLDWLMEQARARGCENFELDSGVQRFEAHRFYFRKRMKISSYHFAISLKGSNSADRRRNYEKRKSLDRDLPRYQTPDNDKR